MIFNRKRKRSVGGKQSGEYSKSYPRKCYKLFQGYISSAAIFSGKIVFVNEGFGWKIHRKGGHFDGKIHRKWRF